MVWLSGLNTILSQVNAGKEATLKDNLQAGSAFVLICAQEPDRHFIIKLPAKPEQKSGHCDLESMYLTLPYAHACVETSFPHAQSLSV
jgi:hypothetical protein